jgi:hypothetical protein
MKNAALCSIGLYYGSSWNLEGGRLEQLGLMTTTILGCAEKR